MNYPKRIYVPGGQFGPDKSTDIQANLHGSGEVYIRADAVRELEERAQSVIDRWYRDPPEEEGGDFLADMYRLKKCLAKFKGDE